MPRQPQRHRPVGGRAAPAPVRGSATTRSCRCPIAALAPLADLPERDVTLDGLTYREVLSVTRSKAGSLRT